MKTKAFIVLLSGILLTSCSLKYNENIASEDVNPEFVFSGAKIYRYEDSKKTAAIEAETIEQYKNSSASYAKNVKFKTFDSKAEESTTGKCGFLFSDSNKKMYQLYDKIELFSETQKAKFYADALKWNGVSEQLTSSRTDTVRIEKDDRVIIGSGFSANGVNGEYVFTGSVSGIIESEVKKEEGN